LWIHLNVTAAEDFLLLTNQSEKRDALVKKLTVSINLEENEAGLDELTNRISLDDEYDQTSEDESDSLSDENQDFTFIN